MTIGDFLPLAAIVFVHSNPEIAIVVGLSGYVIKFFAYQEMILAGQKMESKHPEY